MKKWISLAVAILAMGTAAAQTVIPRTSINYDVNYHWGIIDVMIARGVVTVESDGETFRGTLDGTSIPWEGRIICVDDTLVARTENFGGNLRETVLYQNGWYRRPPVEYFRSPGYDSQNPDYYRNISGQGCYNASDDTMEAITITSDMIGMYNYAQVLDFPNMQPGEKVNVMIESPYSQQLVITYQGEGEFSHNGATHPTYNCTIEYGYGGRMSGFPVECKIGTRDRIPLYFGASLPAGTVELLYNP